MKTLSRLVLKLSLWPSLFTCAGSLVISGLPKRGFASADTDSAGVTIKDWTAAGSGCRAQMKKAGDVVLESVRTENSKGSNLVVLRFKLNKYKLSSPPENPATSITFARECALRIVAQHGAPVRIKSIAARTPITYSKAADMVLQMQFLLRLDGEIVGQSLKETAPGQTIRNAEEVIVVTGKPSDEAQQLAKMDAKSCGAAQMIGFDYTFIAARKQPQDSALIELAEDKQLEIALEIGSCR